MPKRKAKSPPVATAVAAADNDGRRSKASKKQKKSKSKSKKKQKGNSDQSQNAIIASFARGLSHQIPSASLAHIANSADSLRLLLEKSTESLPMGSAIRKAVGENFALCVDALTKEVASRLAEEEETAAEQSHERKDKSQADQGDQEDQTEFAVFSAAQYQKALQLMRSIEDSNEREEYRKKLSSTPFASADVLIPLDDADQHEETPPAKAVLDAFRSASLTGRVNESTVGGYITRMLAAVKAEISRVPVRSVSLIRNFLSCFAMSLCDKASALMSDDGKAAFEYGAIIGLMVHVALDNPEDYLASSGIGGDVEDSSSSSDDDSDIEDDLLGGSARKTNGKRSAHIVANAIQDITCILTLQLMSFGPATPHAIVGIISIFSEEEGGSDVLLQKVSSILSGVLINSSSAPKSAMPSKNMKNGKEKIRMIQRWADGEMEKAGREREEALLSAEAPMENQQRGGHEVDLYDSNDDESDRSDEENSSSEEDGSDDDNEDEDEEQAKAATGSAPDESLFVIDTAPDDDDDDDGEEEVEASLNQEDGEEESSGVPAKKTKGRGATSKSSSRPPRPPASAKKPASLPTTTPRRSARSRSRGDSVSSLASANKTATTATPNTLPRRSTRSRSRGESMGSMGSLHEEGTPRRSARVRSRGDSMSQT